MVPEPPPAELAPSCAEAGVLGVLPGIIGSIQALEAIKLLLDLGDPLVGRMLAFDALEDELPHVQGPRAIRPARRARSTRLTSSSPSTTSCVCLTGPTDRRRHRRATGPAGQAGEPDGDDGDEQGVAEHQHAAEVQAVALEQRRVVLHHVSGEHHRRRHQADEPAISPADRHERHQPDEELRRQQR